jgi:hypothetical protein
MRLLRDAGNYITKARAFVDLARAFVGFFERTFNC